MPEKPNVFIDLIQVVNNKHSYWTPANDTRLIQLLSGKSAWGVTSFRSLKSIIPHPHTVVDIGANIGMSAIEYSKWAKQVISFEACPTLAEIAWANIVNNNCSNVILYRNGLGDVDESKPFSFRDNSTLGAHVINSQRKGQQVEEVSIKTLDSYNLKDVDYIKLDVEGYEGFVLKGAQETLKKYRPVVLIELEPLFLKRYKIFTVEQIQKDFIDLGYVCYTPKLQSMPLVYKQIPRCRDRLFVHKRSEAFLRVRAK